MKTTPDEIAADGSHEASYGWWVENSPTNHSHHVVHGTRSSIAALRVLLAALEQAEAKLAESERARARLRVAIAGPAWTPVEPAEDADRPWLDVAERMREREVRIGVKAMSSAGRMLDAEAERDALEAKLAESERTAVNWHREYHTLKAERDALREAVQALLAKVDRVPSESLRIEDSMSDISQELAALRSALAIRQQEEPKPAEPQAQVIDLMQALKDSLKAWEPKP